MKPKKQKYRLTVTAKGTQRTLRRSWTDWEKCAAHGEKLAKAGRIRGFWVTCENDVITAE
jgi:hypothetical protein